MVDKPGGVYSNIIFNAPARLSALLEQMKLAESRHAAELEGKGGNGPAGSEKPVPKKKPIKTTLAMPSEMEEKSEVEKSEVSQVGLLCEIFSKMDKATEEFSCCLLCDFKRPCVISKDLVWFCRVTGCPRTVFQESHTVNHHYKIMEQFIYKPQN